MMSNDNQAHKILEELYYHYTKLNYNDASLGFLTKALLSSYFEQIEKSKGK